MQIIIGTGTVNKVFEQFAPMAGIDASSTKEDVKKAAASKASWFKRGIKTLGDIFVPIIPAIVATGLLCGLLGGLARVFENMGDTHIYQLLDMFSNSALTFLPILIAISAAKIFGGNIYLGAVIGMIMIHPNLVNAWSVASGAETATLWSWFGLWNVQNVGYQGHVIPVVIAVLLMSTIEKKLHKKVPEMFDLFVTPLCTVLITGFFTMTVIGPVFSQVETWVLSGAKGLIALPFGIGSFIMGAAYAPTVVAGVHHMYNAIELAMIAENGKNLWMPLATAANVAQGAAALAVALKTRQKKIKSMALPASLSAFMGITEPAIFGVNVRFMKPFIAGMAGGAAGAVVASVMHVYATANGVTGLFGFLITTNCFFGYFLTFAVAAGVAFVLSWILYKDADAINESSAVKVSVPSSNENSDTIEFYSPICGEVFPLSEVPDETFASGLLGHGSAIIPHEGKVVAPGNGRVSSLFKTNHAIGLTLDNGAELLIHIGMNTIDLNGKGFKAHVSNGQRVKTGQTLLTFDIDFLKKNGYEPVTPIVIANEDIFSGINVTEKDIVDHEGILIQLKK